MKKFFKTICMTLGLGLLLGSGVMSTAQADDFFNYSIRPPVIPYNFSYKGNHLYCNNERNMCFRYGEAHLTNNMVRRDESEYDVLRRMQQYFAKSFSCELYYESLECYKYSKDRKIVDFMKLKYDSYTQKAKMVRVFYSPYRSSLYEAKRLASKIL